MAIVQVVPGKSEVQLAAWAKGRRIPPKLRNIPGGLFPLMSAAFQVDEYRMMSGWPVPVPDCDIEIKCLVSAEGAVLGNRDAPTSLITGADMRWVADNNYYDQTSFLWAPIQGSVSPWTTTAGYAPTLFTDYDYTIGDERFLDMTVLNFDSNTHDFMWNNLDQVMGGVMGYTVIMVLSPNSMYGNDDSVADNALWGPDSISGAWSQFTVKNQALYLTTEEIPAQKGVGFGSASHNTAPTYLALVVNRPQTTMYAASGPSNVLSKSLVAGAAAEPLSTRFWLGNGPYLDSATMDMALFDLGIYGNPLTKDQVVTEFSSLSTIYGGDS